VKINYATRRPAFPAAMALALLLLVVADYFFYSHKIYPGVYLHGINAGGLTKAETGRLLQEKIDRENISTTEIIFRYRENTWTHTYRELGVAVDWEETLAGAFAAGRKSTLLFNYPERIRLLLKPVRMPLNLAVNSAQFARALAPAAELLDREPLESRFILSEDGLTVVIVPEVPGYCLLLDETRQMLENSLETSPVPEILPFIVREIRPARTASDLREMRVIAEVSSFSTTFAPSPPGRVHNIRLAATALDGVLLEPGSEFSFNSAVGETGATQGYLPAPVIIDGEITDGVGGGVCQVSSTLYNAVLLAGLQVVERAGHSLAVGYVPPGRDAAVAYGWLDLRFQSDPGRGIWIRTFVNGNRLTIRLFGEPAPGKEIKLVTTDLEIIPRNTIYTETDSLPAGTREQAKVGQDGYRVNAWRVIYLDGSEIGRELLSRNIYRPVPDEILVGTGDASLR